MDFISQRVKNGETVPADSSSPDEYSLDRPGWFITMRFCAVAGVAAALVVSRFFFHISRINYPWIWSLVCVLAGINILYTVLLRYGILNISPDISGSERRLSFFFGIQYAVDMLILTFMLHFSGGVTNPFFLYYFFHIVLASILLSKKASYLAAGYAVALFSITVLLESTNVIRHYRLFSFSAHSDHLFTAGILIAFISAVFITVYLTTSVTGHLREYRRQAIRAIADKSKIEMEKSHFLDVVAHDLKSPLAAIETSILSLLDAYKNEYNEDTRETLERIPKRMRDLTRFIQNLLDFSKIRNMDELRNRFKPLHFLPIVTSTVEMYMDQALDKNITISVQAEPDLPRIMGSGEHLERLVGNLISNAIRYTPSGGSVNVKISAVDDDLVLTVADSGIGIPEKELPRVFDEFFRSSNARKATSSGTGLGLPIARFIADKHDGTITVNSVEGEGTVFTVRIPATKEK